MGEQSEDPRTENEILEAAISGLEHGTGLLAKGAADMLIVFHTDEHPLLRD